MFDPTALQITDVPLHRPGPGIDGNAKFTITMGPRPERVTVHVETVDLKDALKDDNSLREMEKMHTEAVPGVDYETVRTTLIFEPRDTAKTLDVPIHGANPGPTKIFLARISTTDGVPILKPNGACLLIS